MEPWWSFGCGVCRVHASPAARQRGGYLCGNGEQAAMEELQNQRSEAGQWNKTSHRDAVKPGKTHFFHLGFLCSGTGGTAGVQHLCCERSSSGWAV